MTFEKINCQAKDCKHNDRGWCQREQISISKNRKCYWYRKKELKL